ncbi:hypothetical protein Val02_64960 [Virgisporangium aliadipatigenens]|uniref:Transglutaminase-like domain-containing protein n=1 Tax=Virgisporangium aliadipatigenens TaxID=741659 RepID=A0A8J3YTI4_9ACTN|nr:transglutaminase domain-containing protein [Virgisporangium aliadipatigenens]GIJ49610.1 hypothetical protein Val02_64960 [Virgisporangium aliadipatigenens]
MKGARSHLSGHAVELVAVVVAVLDASLLYRGFFTGTAWLAPPVCATLAGAVVAWVAHRRRWRARTTALCGAVGAVAVSVGPVLSDPLTAARLRQIAWGAAGGWARMLSVGLPADPSPELVVTPVLIAWFATLAAALLVLRTDAVLLPLVPLCAPLLIGLVMVASTPVVHARSTVVFLACALVLVAVRSVRGRRTRRLVLPAAAHAAGERRLAGISATVVVAVAVGAAGGFAGWPVSGERRMDPRPLRPATVQTPPGITPLALIKPQLVEQPRRRLFLMRVLSGERGAADRIRLAALEHFDGATWTSRTTYLVAGARLARDDALSRPRETTARIVIDGLTGPFLPAFGWPTALRHVDGAPAAVGFSRAAGTLIAASTDLHGLGYEVTGAHRGAGLPTRDARPSSGPDFDRFRALPPGLPPLLPVLCDRIARTEQRPVGRLVALETFLRGLPYRTDAPPGHSYARIGRMLAADNPVEGDGYAEQHASAFAVMARVLGYPSRVAVGYRVAATQSGDVDVDTGNAHAWAEVHFPGYGWVTFDPTDDTRRRPDTVQQPVPTPTPTAVPTDAASVPETAVASVPGSSKSPDPPSSCALRCVLRRIAWSLVLAAGVVAVSIVVAKRWRRVRRRARSDLAGRVLGAWEETTERLIERRVTYPPAMTPNELAAAARHSFGNRVPAIESLAEKATTAVFAPDLLARSDGAWAWSAERDIRRGLYRGWWWLRQPVAWFDVRPLVATRAVRSRLSEGAGRS